MLLNVTLCILIAASCRFTRELTRKSTAGDVLPGEGQEESDEVCARAGLSDRGQDTRLIKGEGADCCPR